MKEITSMIIGVENLSQLQDNIGLLQSEPLLEEEQQKIINLFNDVPEKVIDPRKWKVNK